MDLFIYFLNGRPFILSISHVILENGKWTELNGRPFSRCARLKMLTDSLLGLKDFHPWESFTKVSMIYFLKGFLVESSQQENFLPQPRSPGSLAFRSFLGSKGSKTIGKWSNPAREARRGNFGVFGAQKFKSGAQGQCQLIDCLDFPWLKKVHLIQKVRIYSSGREVDHWSKKWFDRFLLFL